MYFAAVNKGTMGWVSKSRDVASRITFLHFSNSDAWGDTGAFFYFVTYTNQGEEHLS